MAHVLVVEDDHATRLLLSALVRRNGIECTAVGDGVSALQLLAAVPFDAVVLDLILPRVDGFEILRELARTAPEVLPRIVVHTALPSSLLAGHDELRSVAAVLLKPGDIQEVDGAILRVTGLAPVRPFQRRRATSC